MLKISKLADHGVVLMIEAARHGVFAWHTARGLAASTGLPAPTVSKVLKLLEKAGLLASRRGSHGGYRLARQPGQIALLDVVRAIDGEPSLTQCGGGHALRCLRERACPARPTWQLLTDAMLDQLGSFTLADMLAPPTQESVRRRMTTAIGAAAAPAPLDGAMP